MYTLNKQICDGVFMCLVHMLYTLYIIELNMFAYDQVHTTAPFSPSGCLWLQQKHQPHILHSPYAARSHLSQNGVIKLHRKLFLYFSEILEERLLLSERNARLKRRVLKSNWTRKYSTGHIFSGAKKNSNEFHAPASITRNSIRLMRWCNWCGGLRRCRVVRQWSVC